MDGLEAPLALKSSSHPQDLFDSSVGLPSHRQFDHHASSTPAASKDPMRPSSTGSVTFHSASRQTSPMQLPLQQRPHTTGGDGWHGVSGQGRMMGLPHTASQSMTSPQSRGSSRLRRSTPLTPERAGLIRQYKVTILKSRAFCSSRCFHG
jgi:hypothetical protein